MSKMLGIAFGPTEIRALDSLGKVLGVELDVVALGFSFEGSSNAGKFMSAPGLASFTADTIDASLAELARPYSHVASVSSMAAKDLLPRIAARLDGAMITDVISVESPTTFRRPYQAGAAIATVSVSGSPIVLTFRPAGFTGHETERRPTREQIDLNLTAGSVVVRQSGSAGTRPDLSQAKLVISGGRPLKDADTFNRVIGGFADAFGGAVGATRAAVDAAIAPNETQVGQTGKIVAPDLYIAAGISGSTQHMAGIKDSKLIVAINKDPDAPIFESADLGIVGDLFEVLPALQAALKGGVS